MDEVNFNAEDLQINEERLVGIKLNGAVVDRIIYRKLMRVMLL